MFLDLVSLVACVAARHRTPPPRPPPRRARRASPPRSRRLPGWTSWTRRASRRTRDAAAGSVRSIPVPVLSRSCRPRWRAQRDRTPPGRRVSSPASHERARSRSTRAKRSSTSSQSASGRSSSSSRSRSWSARGARAPPLRAAPGLRPDRRRRRRRFAARCRIRVARLPLSRRRRRDLHRRDALAGHRAAPAPLGARRQTAVAHGSAWSSDNPGRPQRVSVSLSFASGNMQKIENDLAPACLL